MKGHGLHMNKISINQAINHSLSLTHTHIQIHVLLVMGWYNEKKTTDQDAEVFR